MEEKKPVEEKKKGLLGKIKKTQTIKKNNYIYLHLWDWVSWFGQVVFSHWHMLIFLHFKFQNKISIPPLLICLYRRFNLNSDN